MPCRNNAISSTTNAASQHVDYPLTEVNLCTFLPIGAKLLLLEEKLGREVVLGAPGSTWARHRARPVMLTKAMT